MSTTKNKPIPYEPYATSTLIVEHALNILKHRAYRDSCQSKASRKVLKDYLLLKNAHKKGPTFGVLFFNAKFEILDELEVPNTEVPSLDVTARAITKTALNNNTSAIILYRYQQTEKLEFTGADSFLLENLTIRMNLFNIRVLDYIILSKTGTMSNPLSTRNQE